MWVWLAVAARAEEPSPPTGMAGHFQDAAMAMLAVAVEDKKGAKSHTKSLATSSVAPQPLRDAAKELLGELGKPEDAGPALADLVGTCAKCHLAGGRGPEPHDLEMIPGGNGVERHMMATMFVWIGLVTPLEQPWELGLDNLLSHVDLESSEEVRAVGQTFSSLVHNAKAAGSWAERREKFGAMVPLCVECHEAAGLTSP